MPPVLFTILTFVGRGTDRSRLGPQDFLSFAGDLGANITIVMETRWLPLHLRESNPVSDGPPPHRNEDPRKTENKGAPRNTAKRVGQRPRKSRRRRSGSVRCGTGRVHQHRNCRTALARPRTHGSESHNLTGSWEKVDVSCFHPEPAHIKSK